MEFIALSFIFGVMVGWGKYCEWKMEQGPEGEARRKQRVLYLQRRREAHFKRIAYLLKKEQTRLANKPKQDATSVKQDGWFGYYIIRDGKKLCTYGIPEAGSHYVRIYE